jgi:DNA primase
MGLETITEEFFVGRVSAEDLLESLGIDLAHRRGEWIMCHCPDWLGNHSNGDANPSFGFHEETMKYNCFVCGGGTVIELVEQMLQVDEDSATRYLMERSNLEPTGAQEFAEQIESILNPYENATPDPSYPPEALFPFQKTHPYLLERGITQEVINDHQIGFDETHYGIVIPHWFMGVLKGWQMRHLVEKDGVYYCPVESCNYKNAKRVKVSKYKNTSHFPKSNTLYAYDQSMAHCKQEGIAWALVVESPMTVLYLKSNGLLNTFGTFGQFSPAQSQLLWPFERVLYWPDNDSAGVTNTKNAIEYLRRYVNLEIVPFVPGAKSDGADVPPDELQSYLAEAVPAVLWTP